MYFFIVYFLLSSLTDHIHTLNEYQCNVGCKLFQFEVRIPGLTN